MKTFVQLGDTVTVTAPANVNAGTGVLVGSLFGIAVNTALSGAPVEIVTVGVFDHAKTDSQAWAVGDRIYWDNTNKLMTTAAAAGANKLVGVAMAAVGGGAGLTTGRVRLTAAFTL